MTERPGRAGRRLLGALAGAAFLLASAAAHAQPLSYSAQLTPLNSSGVGGSAFLTLDGNLLTVRVDATGLEPPPPGAVHPMHIHGRVDANGNPLPDTLPTLALDADGDGFLEVAEGVPAYGPVIVSLTSPPGGAHDNFPVGANGTIHFQQTYDLNDPATFNAGFSSAQLLPLDLREIVLHGLTVGAVGTNTPGEVNGVAGYKEILPVASGLITIAAVPEPGIVLLLGVGLAAMGAARLRLRG